MVLHATKAELCAPIDDRFQSMSEGVYSLRGAVVEPQGFSLAWEASEFFNYTALVGAAIATEPERQHPVKDRVEGSALLAGALVVGLPDRAVDGGRALFGLLKSWNSRTLLRFQEAHITTLRLDHCKIRSTDVLFDKSSIVRFRFDACIFGEMLQGGPFGKLKLPSHLEKLHIRTPIGSSLEFDFSQANSLTSLKVITQDEASARPGLDMEVYSMSREQVKLDDTRRGEFPASLLKCIVNRGVTLELENLVPEARADDGCLPLWGLTIKPERSFPHDALSQTLASSIFAHKCTIRSLVPLTVAASVTRLHLSNTIFEGEGPVIEPPPQLRELEFGNSQGSLRFRLGRATALSSLVIKSHIPTLKVSCIDVFPGAIKTFTIDGTSVLPYTRTAEGVKIAQADLALGPSMDLVLATLKPKILVVDGCKVGDLAQFVASPKTKRLTFKDSQFEGSPTFDDSGAVEELEFQGNDGEVRFDLDDSSQLQGLRFDGNKWTVEHDWFQGLPASLRDFSVMGPNNIGPEILRCLPPTLRSFTLNPSRLSAGRARRTLRGCAVSVVEEERNVASRRFGELFTGQPNAVRVIRGLLRGIESVDSKTGPIMSMLLAGAAGRGKRATAAALATAVQGDLVTLECRRFRGEDCLDLLRSGSFLDELSDAVQSGGKYVLLLNRFDEGHEQLRDLFLGMLDGENGALDLAGRKIVCANAIIVLTARTGSAEVDRLMGGASPDFAAAQKAASRAFEELCEKRMEDRIGTVLPYGA